MRANGAVQRSVRWEDCESLTALGEPGSDVFRARSAPDDRHVALRLWCAGSADEISAARERVGQAACVSHPMLAAVEGCDERGNAAIWIVSEYVPGPTLDAWIAAGRKLPITAAMDL